MKTFAQFLKESYVPDKDDPFAVKTAALILKKNPKHEPSRQIIHMHVWDKLYLRKIRERDEREGRKPVDISKAFQPYKEPPKKKIPFEQTLEIRTASDDVHEVAQANYTGEYKVHKMQFVPMNKIIPGYHWPHKVDPLAAKIKENGWISPIIIDKNGYILEGQHRYFAMKKLKAKTIPAIRIEELDLEESWHSSMKSPYQSMPGSFDIYKNPTRSELAKIIHDSECKSARGIFVGNDVFIWDAMGAIHYEVAHFLKLNTHQRDYFTVKNNRWGSEYVDSDETLRAITNHPWIKKTIPQHRFFHG